MADEQVAPLPPQPMGPAPVQMNYDVIDSVPPGLVVLRIDSHEGNKFIFLDPGAADDLGAKLRAKSRAVRTGLTLPQTNGHRLIVPPGT